MSSNPQFPQYPIPAGMPVWQDAFKTVLYDHLQTAMLIEMYTIPMYLFAGYSIKDPNNDARKTILKIARDEMLHLGLAGNMLCAIGGTPRTYNYTPEFPARLFYTKLELNLKPASKDTILLFRNVEAPEGSQKTKPHTDILPTYKSIGEFYDGLQILLFQADGILNFLGNGAFQKDTVPRQLDNTAYGSLFTISDPRQALQALKVIVEQGEGGALGITGSHYALFQEIYNGPDLDHYDVAENLDSKDYKNETFYPVMVACDAAYSFLLLTMEKLWQIDDPEKREPIIRNNIRRSMSPVIGALAKFLVQQQITDSTKHVGPPFRHHEFEGNALDDLKLWVGRAVEAYPELESVKTVVDDFIDLN